MPTKVEPNGNGGTLNVIFSCNGCHDRIVKFRGSALIEGSKRTVVGLALAVAFFITGHGYAKFSRTLRQCLGISCISKNPYYEVIKLVYPHITDILNEMCEEEKERMKQLDREELGSWERAVVTSDGVWYTRGHFSKNGSFIIKNYLTGGLYGMGISACVEKMMLWTRSCLRERQSQWKDFLQVNVTRRPGKRAVRCRLYGKTGI